MEKNRLILTDIELESPLSQYFDYKNIEYSRLPTDSDVPLVDIIEDRIKGRADVILMLGLHPRYNQPQNRSSMEQLYKQKSIYNDFHRLRQRVTLLIYDDSDVIMKLKRFRQNFGYRSWLNYQRPIILTDGLVGENLRNDYKDCDFIELQPEIFQHNMVFPELCTSKNHKPTSDYLCLMADKSSRPFRRVLNEKIITTGILDNMIYSFKKRDSITFDDLGNHFNQFVVDNLTWKDGFPSVDLYNQTNLEVVAETICDDHDESFFPTEKTTKPISMKHPFIVLANKNFLKNLRELGFRTFHEHLDESYDSEPMIEGRIDIIIKNLIALKNRTDKIYKDTKEIRDHNHLTLQHKAGEWRTKLFQTMDSIWRNI